MPRFEASDAIIEAWEACTDDISGETDDGKPLDEIVAIIDANDCESMESVNVNGELDIPIDCDE